MCCYKERVIEKSSWFFVKCVQLHYFVGSGNLNHGVVQHVTESRVGLELEGV